MGLIAAALSEGERRRGARIAGLARWRPLICCARRAMRNGSGSLSTRPAVGRGKAVIHGSHLDLEVGDLHVAYGKEVQALGERVLGSAYAPKTVESIGRLGHLAVRRPSKERSVISSSS
jgi:hypothetical protein